MKIILKHTLKNIFRKFGRTFLLTFCIFMCTLAASLCLDMSGSIKRMFANQFGTMLGSTDLQFAAFENIDEEAFSSLPDNNHLLLSATSASFYRRDPQLYSYAVETDVTVYSFDLKKGHEMKILLTELDLKENEAALTKDLGELLGYKEGDSIYLYDELGEKKEFTVTALIEKGGLASQRDTCIISPEGMDRLTGDNTRYMQAFIDIKNDKLITGSEKQLKELFPESEILNIKNNEDIDNAVNRISALFYTLFAVCLLVAVIITVTVSRRIMSERMSVVGTLRSVGVSQGKTAFFLLMENIIYALTGSIPAVALYSSVRLVFLDSFFTSDGNALDFGTMPFALKVSIVIGAVAVECACTLSEIIKASKTAIRDIIFLNKDSEFRFSKIKTIAALIMTVTAAVLFFIKDSFPASILCFIFAIIGVFFLFPYVSVFFSKAFEKLFSKLNMPAARLGACEAGTKKSTIASSSLIVAAASISVLLFVIADSMYFLFCQDSFPEAEIIVRGPSMEDFYFDYIDDLDGVISTENIYDSEFSDVIINGHENKGMIVLGFDGCSLFTGIEGMPESVSDDEFYIDRTFAEKNGLNIGDETELTVNFTDFIPQKFTLKVGGFINSTYYSITGQTILLSKNNYLLCEEDIPRYILINTDGTRDDELVDKISKYSSNTCEEVVIREKYNDDIIRENKSETQMIKMLGFLGIFLTFIGVVSNQLIGFESRKRENAVLMSVAMSRKKLKRMLLAETVISSVIPLICAVPLGILLAVPIRNVMNYIEMDLHLVIDIPEYIGLISVLLVIFTLTVIFPYRLLRKMKLAEQLKYE